MNRTLVAGGIAVVAVFAGIVYFAREPAPPAQSTDQRAAPAVAQPAPDEGMKPQGAKLPVTRSSAAARPVTTDPRLAALMVSPNDDLIEFVAGADGKVFKEIDNDPNSIGYRKPLREYTYAGNQVIRLVAYKYLGDQIQIIKADVVYKPDGSIDKFQESTSYEPGPKRN